MTFFKLRWTLSLSSLPHSLILPVTTLSLREMTTLQAPEKLVPGLRIGTQSMVLWPSTNLTHSHGQSLRNSQTSLILYISHHLHCYLWDPSQRHLSPASSQCLLIASLWSSGKPIGSFQNAVLSRSPLA